MGYHYVNGDLVGDGVLDASRPEVMIYEATDSGLQLVGVEFVVGGVVAVGVSLVVVSLGVVPLPSGSPPDQFSVASAPLESGPSPAAVKPPPAISEMSARHARLRTPEAVVMRRSSSSRGRPIVVVGASSPTNAGTPTGIHIGRQAPRGKGFVIASTIRCSGRSHRVPTASA